MKQKTLKPVISMSRSQLLSEKIANHKRQMELTDKLIELGYGYYRHSEICKLDIPEAIEQTALIDRAFNIRMELDSIYLGYRKATPSKEAV